MIKALNYTVATHTNNKVGFKSDSHPNIDKALKLANTPEVKDAIKLTINKNADASLVVDVLHDLNFESDSLKKNDLDAMEQTLKAQNEWQITKRHREVIKDDFKDILEENGRELK